MLLLYYTNTILFWLSLTKSNRNPSLTKHLNEYDFQFLPQEVCIAQCVGKMSHTIIPTESMSTHIEVISAWEQSTALQHCVEFCSKDGSTSNQNTTAIKQIHENYSLNLICRDESSLNFLINLHTTNIRENDSKQFVEMNMQSTTHSPLQNISSNTTPSLLAASHLRMQNQSMLASSTSSSSSPSSSSSTSAVHDIEDDDVVVLFVIKIHLANETDIYKVYLSDDKFFKLESLSPNTTYNITAFAVRSDNKYSVIALGEQFQTLRRGYTPGNITHIKVVDFIEDMVNPTHLSATVIWKPPQDMTCSYDIICFSPISNDFEMQPMEIRDPRQLYKYQLDNMTFSTEYKVGIRAKNVKNMKESELFWKTFYAPSCAEWHNFNFNICAPDAPENLQYQLYYGAPNLYSLNVSWNRPTHYPDNYTLCINDLSPLGKVHYFNISKEMTQIFIEDIEIFSAYFDVLLTSSTRGGNATSLAVKDIDAVIQFPEKNHFVKLFAVILAPICCVAILSLTIFMIYHRRAKLKRYQERCKYFEELEKKAPIDPKDNFDFVHNLNASKQRTSMDLHISMEIEDTTTLFTDEMEIDRSQLTLYEVLGEGAFGLVKRGIYKDNKLKYGTEHEVAVKMLKDHPTADDVRAFRREIEVMKSVERHPNIVGILGHCTRLSNEMMLLTEYCSFGNLLDFLRDEWRFLHDIQQKRQKLTSTIVNVELPYVPELNLNDKHEYNQNAQNSSQKTTAGTSPPNSPPPPVPCLCCKFSVMSVANGECCNNRVEELENIKNQNQNKQSATSYEHNGERFHINNNEFIIEQFKRKYNDFGKQHCGTRPIHDKVNSLLPSEWKDKLTRIKDIKGSTSFASHNIAGNDIKSSSRITSPVAENKSYGYHGCCTNSCKCNVDVIIRNIDSSDSSREQEELDRLLSNHQPQLHSYHAPAQNSTTNLCSTKIAINSCDCRSPKTIRAPCLPPPPATKEMAATPGKNAFENKSYFKLFSGKDKPLSSQRQHSIIRSNSTTNTIISSSNTDGCTSTTNVALKKLPATTTNINGDNDESDDNANWPQRIPLKAGDLLDISRQVAVGMDFLAKNKVVHRDLAARNVLVAPDRTIKIADFGLSRDIYQENIYKKTGNGKLPIKWLALESLTHQVYTTQSDVWSYGILLYEIVTLGATPYPSIPTNRLLHLLKTGYRMEKPKNCGNEFYALMYTCWNAVPNERPTFIEIIKNLDSMLSKSTTSTPTANIKERTKPSLTMSVAQQGPWHKNNRKNLNTNDDGDDDDDNDVDYYTENKDSPVLQICSDDSYLNPL